MKDYPLHLVKPEYRSDFIKFMETGEAREEFLNYLDNDPDVQEAWDIAFEEETKELREMASKLEKFFMSLLPSEQNGLMKKIKDVLKKR